MLTHKIAVGCAALLLSGCANASPQLRLSRTLLVTGALTTVVGGLTAAGCVDNGDGCSGGPGDADLAVGVPLLALGTGLIVAGLIVKPKRAPPLYRAPPSVPPPPATRPPARGPYLQTTEY